MATLDELNSAIANQQAMLSQQDTATAKFQENLATLRESMAALQETAVKASGGMDKMTQGLIGWGVAAHAVGTGISMMTSAFMGHVANMRIAQGKLSEGFAMQAQNRGVGLTAMAAIPFVGGPMADALHAWRNERSGSGVNIAVAGLLEGAYGRQRGISDQLSMAVAGGALEQKYRYDPEMLDYQKQLQALRPAESNISDMQNTLAERKANAATVAEEEGGYFGRAKRSLYGVMGAGFGPAIPLWAALRNEAGEAREASAQALYKTASGQFGPEIASQGKKVEALQAQAYESYKQNFYGGMQTQSFADWRSSGVSSATVGGPEADLLVTGVVLTNTLLAQIVDNTKGYREQTGVRK